MTAYLLRSLTPKVLAVAVRSTGERGDGWRCYLDVVPGICHLDEAEQVADRGVTQPEDVARALFPQLAGKPYYL